jgi:ribosomal protein S18 acetylase RimI-like enzyme
MCRALSFLPTAYFDDVLAKKPTYDSTSIELVALDSGRLVGVLDVAVYGPLATIETIAVHPDHQRGSIATALLDEALLQLPPNVDVLDAWTREDEAANRWYLARGFVETFRYLHVYATGDEVDTSLRATDATLSPVYAFLHAAIDHEEAMRERFARVHVCRRYERDLRGARATG